MTTSKDFRTLFSQLICTVMTARETDAFEMAASPFFWDSTEQVGCFVIIADHRFYDSGDSAQIAVDLEDTGRMQVK